MASTSLAGSLALPIEAALRAIPKELRSSIYVVSFFVCDDEDDPRRPTLTVGYNTVERWKASIPAASDSAEAKWNFAFWLQNELIKFGGDSASGAALVGAGVASTGLSYEDADADAAEDADFEACLERGVQITEAFVRECCEVVRRLHASGAVAEIFGRSIPVLVHELEVYEGIAGQNEAVNPPGVCAEFAQWVRGE
jgi:hypothetical protein